MTPAPMTPEEHTARVIDWWARRDERLRDPDGWLTLVGLHWLAPGENRFGSDPANPVMLSGEGVPAVAGTLIVREGRVRLVAATPALTADGSPISEVELVDDAEGEPTVVDLADLRMYVIRREERLGLRVRDRRSPAIAAFRGMDHFPIDHAWRVEARLEPAAAGATIEIVDVTGQVSHQPTPGHVVFEVDGASWHIAALPGDDDGSVWLIFGDATNGAETYGGGRFLYSEPVRDDETVAVDFNLAYNPPCVFSPHATCPLPPAENRLPIRIEAGERSFEP